MMAILIFHFLLKVANQARKPVETMRIRKIMPRAKTAIRNIMVCFCEIMVFFPEGCKSNYPSDGIERSEANQKRGRGVGGGLVHPELHFHFLIRAGGN